MKTLTPFFMSILIRRAAEEDVPAIVNIGRSAVELSHRESCSVADMNEFLDAYYNEEAIRAEVMARENIYHMICYNGKSAGFSKMILNAPHERLPHANTTKLDRIYLSSEYYGLKLGFELLNANIRLSKDNHQGGIWLFTWQGNERAVNFYKRNGFKIIGEHRFKVTENHYNPHYQMLLEY